MTRCVSGPGGEHLATVRTAAYGRRSAAYAGRSAAYA